MRYYPKRNEDTNVNAPAIRIKELINASVNADQPKDRLVFKDCVFSIFAAKGTDNELFGNVLRVRNTGHSGRAVYKFDDYSTHYCMFAESVPLGCMTATRFVDGELDCAEFYPSVLTEQFGDILFSCCKLRILRSTYSGIRSIRSLIRAVWKDQINHGVRLDIMNAQSSFQRFYERIGYEAIAGSEFIHPALGTDSIAMFMPADPDRRSFCCDEFRDIRRPLNLEEVKTAIHPTS